MTGSLDRLRGIRGQTYLPKSEVTSYFRVPDRSPVAALLPEDARAALAIEDELRLIEADDTAAVERLVDFVWGDVA